MYDRQTETLWSHFTGEGIVGELTGDELDDVPARDRVVERLARRPPRRARAEPRDRLRP